MNESSGIGSPHERELNYYRNECNDLGGRLLRLQEEQSQAFLEARRSRTVVRMVREAYRLADPTQATADVGGTLLQIVVENALCDQAALLREEPPGSGRFLVSNAIGGRNGEADEVIIPDAPKFFFTSSSRLDRVPAGLLEVLHLPFVLWAYDRSSGHALVIGNRSESNVSRPFESGDQELIETALYVYLDVLYRKHAEAQLRQAKQSAQEANLAHLGFLNLLSSQLQTPVDRIDAVLDAIALHFGMTEPEPLQAATRQLTKSSRDLVMLANDALQLTSPNDQSYPLDVQWVDLGEVVNQAYRSSYPASLKGGVDVKMSVPRRKVSVCVDRISMQRAIRGVVCASVARALPGSAVKLSAARRSDGAVEILVSSPVEGAQAYAAEPAPPDVSGQESHSLNGSGSEWLANARRIVEAHEGMLVTEARSSGGSQARIILPLHITRDDNGFP